MVGIKLECAAQHTCSFLVAGIAEEQPTKHVHRIRILRRQDQRLLGRRNTYISDVDIILCAEDRQQTPVTGVFRRESRRGLVRLQSTDQISCFRVRLAHRDQPGRVLRI